MVRARDKRCRVPGCPTPYYHLTVAHLHHKGIGGNPKGDRSKANQMILLCWHHHQGPRGYDGMYPLAITPLTDAGTDGHCQFEIYKILVGK